MVTYYVKKDDIYKVTATVNCAVYNSNNETLVTCDAGESVAFKAPTAKISVSDDNASLIRLVNESSGGGAGIAEHMADSSVHVSNAEKLNWNSSVDSVTTKHPVYDSHIDNSTAHITADERKNWNEAYTHLGNTDVHITGDERDMWNKAEVVYDISKMFPGEGQGEDGDGWLLAYAINKLKQYLIDNEQEDKIKAGLRIKFKYGSTGQYQTYTWNGGNWDDMSFSVWNYDITSIHLDEFNTLLGNELSTHYNNESKDTSGEKTILHVTPTERTSWNNMVEDYLPKNANTANAIMITDADGNIVPSTVISVAELNTLNNNLTNISTKLSNIESRITALENA